jgi:hypothetical protein
MITNKNFILAFTLTCVSLPAWAVLGMPDNTARYSLTYDRSLVKINDPQGESQRTSVPSIAVGYSDWLPNGSRYLLQLQQFSTEFHASETEVGQTVRQLRLKTAIQKDLTSVGNYMPWLNVGILWIREDYSLRHTKTSDGFLQNRYHDRVEKNIGFAFDIGFDHDVSREWAVGAFASQTLLPNTNTNTRGIGFILTYQP